MTSRIGFRTSLVCCGLLLLCVATAGITAGQSIDAQGSPDITVYAPDNELTPGTETTLTLQFDNEGRMRKGSENNREIVTTARNVVTSIDTEDAPIVVTTGERSLGSITEDEPKDADFNIEVPNDASPGTYEIEVNYAYRYTSNARTLEGQRDLQRESSRSPRETIEIEITNDARFEVTEVDSTLRVGEEGEITGELENIGNDDARNAEISFAPNSETVVALESNVAVGDIDGGDATQFSIPVEVTSDAEAVPKRFDLPVSFRDENGIRQSDDDPEFLVDVAGKRDTFLVEPVNNSIPAGGSQPLDLRVTNNLDEPVTDIEGKLFADDPLDSTNDETFTESLDPGETTTVTVDLSASSSATIKNYPTSIDFRYVDSDGDSKLSDSYRMAISVTEPDDNGGSPLPLVIGLLIVAGAVAFLWRRGTFDNVDLPGND